MHETTRIGYTHAQVSELTCFGVEGVTLGVVLKHEFPESRNLYLEGDNTTLREPNHFTLTTNT